MDIPSTETFQPAYDSNQFTIPSTLSGLQPLPEFDLNKSVVQAMNRVVGTPHMTVIIRSILDRELESSPFRHEATAIVRDINILHDQILTGGLIYRIAIFKLVLGLCKLIIDHCATEMATINQHIVEEQPAKRVAIVYNALADKSILFAQLVHHIQSFANLVADTYASVLDTLDDPNLTDEKKIVDTNETITVMCAFAADTYLCYAMAFNAYSKTSPWTWRYIKASRAEQCVDTEFGLALLIYATTLRGPLLPSNPMMQYVTDGNILSHIYMRRQIITSTEAMSLVTLQFKAIQLQLLEFQNVLLCYGIEASHLPASDLLTQSTRSLGELVDMEVINNRTSALKRGLRNTSNFGRFYRPKCDMTSSRFYLRDTYAMMCATALDIIYCRSLVDGEYNII